MGGERRDRAKLDRAKAGSPSGWSPGMLPEGDFRGWAAIEGWADSIAGAMQVEQTAPR